MHEGRRRVLVWLLAGALLAAAAPASAGWRPGRGRAINFAERRDGSVRFAVIAPDGRMFRYRARGTVPAASVVKVMFMAAYLRRPPVRDRALRDADRALLGPMIKRSDNAAATRIADLLGPRPLNRLARVAGMRDFRYTRPWGLTRTSARDQVRFMFRLERYIPTRHERYARYLLSHITESQRWGIGRLVRPRWRFFFKGGWGSGTGRVGHQVAFIERGNRRIAVALLTEHSPSHGYANETLHGLAARLLRALP